MHESPKYNIENKSKTTTNCMIQYIAGSKTDKPHLRHWNLGQSLQMGWGGPRGSKDRDFQGAGSDFIILTQTPNPQVNFTHENSFKL